MKKKKKYVYTVRLLDPTAKDWARMGTVVTCHVQKEPCLRCENNDDCDGGPFCGCDCHDGGLSEGETTKEPKE